MLMQRIPPETTERERRPERPSPMPRDLGVWRFLAQTEDQSRFHLVRTRRGVNLFWVSPGPASDTMVASWHLHGLLWANRGFRPIQRRERLHKAYDTIATDND